MRNNSHIAFLLSAALMGCATDPADSSGPDGPGGKADGPGEQVALQIEASTTTLAPNVEIRWPHAVDATSSADDVVNRELDFEKITDAKLADVQREWASGDPGDYHQGVGAADYEVTANRRGVLSVSIWYETMYAYPDTHHAYLNFNNKTGTPVAITDILEASALPMIAAKLDAQLQTRIADTKAGFADEIAAGSIAADTWDDLHVTADSLSTFTTNANGITFHWDAGFPHVIQALAPDGDFAVSAAELQPHVKRSGPWGTGGN